MSDIELIHGDCLVEMAKFDDGQFDAVVTDPPFNAGKSFNNDRLSELDFRAFCNRLALELYRLGVPNILVEVGKGDVIMRQELERYFQFKYSICLNYTNSMRNGAIGYANFGLVLWFSNNGKCHQRYKDRIDSALHSTKGQFEHPSPKETEHYSKLVEMFSPEGAVILDPFMGSGTTAIACIQTGRNCVGIEIDKDYYDIACKRVEEAQAQMRLPLEAH